MKTVDFSQYEFTIFDDYEGEPPVIMFRDRNYAPERAAWLSSCGIQKTPEEIGWPDSADAELISVLRKKFPKYRFIENCENQFEFEELWSVRDDLESLNLKYIEKKNDP